MVGMEIDKIAKIARIQLSGEEKKHLQKQLDQILEWANSLGEMKLGEESYFTEKTNVFREDRIVPNPDYKLIVKNFPASKKGKLSVPRGL